MVEENFFLPTAHSCQAHLQLEPPSPWQALPPDLCEISTLPPPLLKPASLTTSHKRVPLIAPTLYSLPYALLNYSPIAYDELNHSRWGSLPDLPFIPIITEEEKKPEVRMAPGITPTSAPSLCSRTLCGVVTAITWYSDMNSCHSWHLSTSPESTAPGQQ